MGVNLTPISVRTELSLADLREKTLAVDAAGELYQFLALIRQRDGTPLHDSQGHITSHLSGLFYRTTRLITDHRMKLAFVFDGRPPALKAEEIARRKAVKERYTREYSQALAAGDLARAYSKSTMTSRLSPEMLQDARLLLDLLGIPWLQAPCEGEAQAAHMAERGDVWSAVSKDYDCLLFGTPRLVRFLTISGREFMPSKQTSRPITPELIERDAMLARYGLTREQLVDLALLVGTDFNPGVKGIGPKKALKLVQDYGAIEQMPEDIRAHVAGFESVRRIFTEPEVTSDYHLEWRPADEPGLIDFLCGRREFDPERVRRAVERIRS